MKSVILVITNFILNQFPTFLSTVSLDPGVDYRRKNLAGSDKLYFNINDPEEAAEESLNAIFKFMAAKETDDVRPITIRIKGPEQLFHRIHLPFDVH